MKGILFYLLMLIVAASCQPEKVSGSGSISIKSSILSEKNIIPGAERLPEYYPLIKGKNIGMVVNQTSRVKQKHLVDTLSGIGVRIKTIFAPEHGFRGEADAGEKIIDGKDSATGLPVISLYGSKKKPSRDDLAGIDIMLFDIQDVGVRFYTYISTLHYVMEACAENQIPLLLLDRPNPNGHYIDGPVLQKTFTSFVGMHPVPVVYGMTIGEYAMMINGENWLPNSLQCSLNIIKCLQYNHAQMYELPVKPSPNLPNLRSILLYPSLCFFEGTTLSMGRGTDKQFQVIGHPALSSDFSFTPVSKPGAKSPVWQDKVCYGEDLTKKTIQQLLDKKSLEISYLIKYYKLLESRGEKFFLENDFFDKLAGTDSLRKMLMQGKDEKNIRDSWQIDLENFKKVRKKYLLYE